MPGRWGLRWYAVARGVVEGFCRVFWRVSVEGRENVPTDTPFVPVSYTHLTLPTNREV